MSDTLFAPRGLYAITNGPRTDLFDVATAALAGGASIVQYRDKTRDARRRLTEACELHRLCRRHGAALIINDDVDLALTSQADGVHLGRDDADITDARGQLGETAIIGVSCYADIERARHFAAAGADYLAFGAFFPTPNKPDAARATTDLLENARTLGPPLVAIGGINPDNGEPLIAAGADFLAIISAVFDAPDVRGAAQSVTHLFARSEKSS